jgi:hypothetical protein
MDRKESRERHDNDRQQKLAKLQTFLEGIDLLDTGEERRRLAESLDIVIDPNVTSQETAVPDNLTRLTFGEDDLTE